MSQPLPPRPSLAQLRKQAKELRSSGSHPTLASAQAALAREYDFPSWPKLKLAVEQDALWRFIDEGDAEAVRTLVRSSRTLARLPRADGSYPLHHAAERNNAAIVEVLVGAGASLEATYAHSAHTALSWAITVGSFGAAHRLVELGDKPDLFCAAGLGLLANVQSFWKDGVLAPHPSKTGSSRFADNGDRLPRPPASDIDQVSDALYIAARSGHFEIGKWLLDHGADPNWRGYCGAPPLAWAEFSGDAALCALLRERGASDEVRDQDFRATPRVFGLMVYAAWGFADRLRERLAADPSVVNAQGGYGTLLNASAYNGQTETAAVLLEWGADRTIRNAAGLTPAELATAQGFAGLAELINSGGKA